MMTRLIWGNPATKDGPRVPTGSRPRPPRPPPSLPPSPDDARQVPVACHRRGLGIRPRAPQDSWVRPSRHPRQPRALCRARPALFPSSDVRRTRMIESLMTVGPPGEAQTSTRLLERRPEGACFETNSSLTLDSCTLRRRVSGFGHPLDWIVSTVAALHRLSPTYSIPLRT